MTDTENSQQPPYPVNFKGSRLARWLLSQAGWSVQFDGFPTRQGVAIVYPHTSNWDFVVMILAKWAVGVPARFWGKDSLFRIPLLGRWMRWLGGIPIDRHSAKGAVGEMVALFEAHKAQDQLLWLGLSPEGTRKHTPGWRSGFYQVAHGADVPVAVMALDYAQKMIRMTDFVRLTGQLDQDYLKIDAIYKGVQGLHAAQAAPVKPLPSKAAVQALTTDSTT
jgi:1-acyl-sn-glycerol-3-phosphate acyltransferase